MTIYKTNEELKTFSEQRKGRASELLSTAVPERINETTYLVPSSDGTKKYTVSHVDTYSCECIDYLQRCKGQGLYCKHIHGIILFNKLKNKVEMDDFQVEDITDEKVCQSCKSENIIKKGIRHNKSGNKQGYNCKACGAFFVIDPAKGIKGNARVLCLAMDMFRAETTSRDHTTLEQQVYGQDERACSHAKTADRREDAHRRAGYPSRQG
jgi:hypothetical protein